MSAMSIEVIERHIKDAADRYGSLHEQLHSVQEKDLIKESRLLELAGNNTNKVSTYYRDYVAQIKEKMSIVNIEKKKYLQYKKDYNRVPSKLRENRSPSPTANKYKNTVGYNKTR